MNTITSIYLLLIKYGQQRAQKKHRVNATKEERRKEKQETWET